MNFVQRTAPLWLAIACVIALGGCSSFEREWRAAGTAPKSRQDSLAGAWEGRWVSARHGSPTRPAGGRLRGIFGRRSDAEYTAFFKANWLIFSSSYRTSFRTEGRGRERRLSGAHDLGPLFGGVYRHVGRATPERFESRYDSRYDSGRFEMRRP